jgi:hypothetical protein
MPLATQTLAGERLSSELVSPSNDIRNIEIEFRERRGEIYRLLHFLSYLFSFKITDRFVREK